MASQNHSNGRVCNDDEDFDETSKLLRTIPPGLSARTHSISGTKSVILEDPLVRKSRWRSIRVMYLTLFLSSVSFSICMSSLYPYLKVLDPSAGTSFLGWIVAAYSLGQLVASPFFGTWSNWRARTSEPILVSLVINILANILYMYLESIKTDPKAFFILARVFIGFGAGNVAVVRSYVSGATTIVERTPAMANIAAFQAVGFIIGPLIQTALVPIGYPGPIHSAGFHLDLYTSTALFSALVGVVNVVLLIAVFKEHRVDDDLLPQSNIQGEPDLDDQSDYDYKLDYVGILSCVGLFFSVLFIFSVFETIATPLTMHMFAWTKKEATLYVGIILGVAGLASIFVFAAIKILAKRFNERYLLLGGYIICLVGFFVYLPWGGVYPDIKPAAVGPSSFHNATYVPSNWTTPSVTTEQPASTSTGFPLTTEISVSTEFPSTEWTSSQYTTNGYTSASTSKTTFSTASTASTVTTAAESTTSTGSSSSGFTTIASVTTALHSTRDFTSGATLTTVGEITTTLMPLSESTETTKEAPAKFADFSAPNEMHSSSADIQTSGGALRTQSVSKFGSPSAAIHFNNYINSALNRDHSNVLIFRRQTDSKSNVNTDLQENHAYSTSTTTATVSTTTALGENTTVEGVGCPDTYDWCYDTPAINIGQFLGGTLLIAVGYPTCSVMVYTIYSKMLGPKPQGVWMGVITASGSLARTLGPIFVSQVYDAYGPRITFILIMALIGITVLGLLLVFRRLVPYKRFRKSNV